MFSGKLKYIELSQEITRYINERSQDASTLPSERVLAEYFSVSRGTVRKALEIIKEKGLIDKRVGSGNFISTRNYTKDLTTISSITEYIEDTHLDIFIEISEFQKNVYIPKELPFFESLKQKLMHRFIRLVYIKGQPRWYEEFFLSADIFPKMEEKDAGDVLKYAEGKLGLKIGNYFQTIQIHTPENKVLKKLQIKKTPLLNVYSHAVLQSGEIFQATIQYFHPEYQLRIIGHR